MRTILYINNGLCSDLNQLQESIRNISYGSEVYTDIIEYALCGDLTAWLHEHGHEEIAKKVDSIDKTMGDTDFLNKLTNILLDKALTIKKPKYSNCFSCDISIPSKSSKEIVVLLSITPKTFINENFEIKVSCGWGTKARVFNPSQYEGNTNYNESVSFHRRSNKKIEKIQVTIDGEIVFKKSIKLPEPNPNAFIQSGIKYPSSTYQSKKEPEYIVTAGGIKSKEEWMKEREDENKKRQEENKKRFNKLKVREIDIKEDAMITRFRRKHGL